MPKKKGNKNNNKNNKKFNKKWIISISIWTFILALIFSLISENILRNLNIGLAFIVLISIISLGVVFDTIGIAVAAADEKPFHSMAANRISVAKYAVKLIRNASTVSNFCNDVVGDICGIISGAAGTIIVIKIVESYGIMQGTFISIGMSGLIASLTVGGKALGKEVALSKTREILFYTAKVLLFIDNKLGIKILKKKK